MSLRLLSSLRLSWPRRLDIALFAAAFAIGLSAPTWHGWSYGPMVENGPVETAQVAALLLAAVLFLRGSVRLDTWSALTTVGLAGFSLLCAVRELPRCDSAYYDFGPCVSGSWKNAIYMSAAAVVVAVVVAVPGLRPTRFGKKALRSLPGFIPRLWPLSILLALLVAAQVAETMRALTIEEPLELASYCLLAVFGLMAAQAGDREAHRDRDARASEECEA